MTFEQRMMADLGFAPEAPEAVAGTDLIKVDAATLAKTFGVTTRQITALATDGVVIKTARATFDLLASTRNYIEKLRKPDGGAKERLTLAQAELAELKLQESRAALLPASAVEREWAGILRDVRAAMLAVPTRVQQHSASISLATIGTIDHEIRCALQQLTLERIDP
jgi:terminase small subunit / prophage DNA-packing protein